MVNRSLPQLNTNAATGGASICLLKERGPKTAIELKLAFKLNWGIHQVLQRCVSCVLECCRTASFQQQKLVVRWPVDAPGLHSVTVKYYSDCKSTQLASKLHLPNSQEILITAVKSKQTGSCASLHLEGKLYRQLLIPLASLQEEALKGKRVSFEGSSTHQRRQEM